MLPTRNIRPIPHLRTTIRMACLDAGQSPQVIPAFHENFLPGIAGGSLGPVLFVPALPEQKLSHPSPGWPAHGKLKEV